MLMPLSHPDRARLAKLLGMLGSSFDGEVVNAARAADRLIKRANETWESVIIGATLTLPPPHATWNREPATVPEHWEETKKYQTYTSVISEWESEFLASIGLRYTLTEKQEKVLARIRVKIELYERYKDSEW